MKQSLLRWMCIGLAMLVLGPIAGSLMHGLRAPDGGSAATILLSESPGMGVVLALGVVGLALLGGLIGGLVCGPRIGLLCAGLVMGWAAFSTGHLDAVIRRTQSHATYWTLSKESLVLGAMMLAAAWIVLKTSPLERGTTPGDRDSMFSKEGLTGTLVAVVAGAAAAIVVARSDQVGQTVGAAAAAGIVGTLLGRVVAHRAPLVSFVFAGMLLAVIGPASGVLVDGAATAQRVYAGHSFALARLMPLDWIAGILIGVPMGAAWAASMVHKAVAESGSAKVATAH